MAATMAIENMYMSNDCLKVLIDVANGTKTHEELRQEIVKKYVR